jgi:hypothetical protein
MEKNRIQNEHPRSFFRELRNSFFGLKMLKFFDEDPDPGSGIFSTLDPGSGINILDPQSAVMQICFC